MSRYARASDADGGQRVTALELFYDLVFVFAITQVSHLLLDHLSWAGLGQSALVLLVVWWSWNYTTWATNELDPDRVAVRVMLIALMLSSLVMAVAIPQAFGARGLLFAGAYVAIQIGRHAFLAFAAAAPGTIERERSTHILTWFVAAGVLWLAGGVAEGTARTALWVAALAVDYAGPMFTYPVPGRAPVAPAAWEISVGHFTERFQLFVILALGESIVITGATTSESDLTPARVTGLGLAFLVSAAMWWLYFNLVARISERRLELAEDRTRLARDAYVYLHIPLVAGIIVAAVGDELLIAHPGDVLAARELAALAGGPALYLLAHVAYRRRMAGTYSAKRLAGAAGCVLAGVLGLAVPALAVGALVLGVLVSVIVAEQVAAARRAAGGGPSPLERLEAAAAARR